MRKSSRSSQINSLAAKSEIVRKSVFSTSGHEALEPADSERGHGNATRAPAPNFRIRRSRSLASHWTILRESTSWRGPNPTSGRWRRDCLCALGRISSVRCTTLRVIRLLKHGSELEAMNFAGGTLTIVSLAIVGRTEMNGGDPKAMVSTAGQGAVRTNQRMPNATTANGSFHFDHRTAGDTRGNGDFHSRTDSRFRTARLHSSNISSKKFWL